MIKPFAFFRFKDRIYLRDEGRLNKKLVPHSIKLSNLAFLFSETFYK